MATTSGVQSDQSTDEEILNYMRAKRLVEVFEECLRRLLRERWNERARLFNTGLLWTDGPECGKALCDLCCSTNMRFTISTNMRDAYIQGRIGALDTTNLLAALEALQQDVKSHSVVNNPAQPPAKNGSGSKPPAATSSKPSNAEIDSLVAQWVKLAPFLDILHRLRNELAHLASMALTEPELANMVERTDSCIAPLGLLPQLAEEALDIDLEQNVGLGALKSDSDCLTWKSEGLEQFQLRQYAQALDCFSKALDANSVSALDAAFLHRYSAEALLQMAGNDLSALDKAKLACSMVPSLWRSHILLSKCYIRCCKFDKALKAVEMTSSCPQALKKFSKVIEAQKAVVLHRIAIESVLKSVGSRETLPAKDVHLVLQQAQTMEFGNHYFDALQRYVKASHSGSALGSFRVAYILIRGLADVPKETRMKAVEYAERGAEDWNDRRDLNPLHPSGVPMGVAESMYLLGELYDRGFHMAARSPEIAQKWYKKSVEKGFALAKPLLFVNEK